MQRYFDVFDSKSLDKTLLSQKMATSAGWRYNILINKMHS